MSTGSGFFGEEPGADSRPPEEGSGAANRRSEESTFADVLNSFTLDSGRGRKKRKKKSKEDSRGDAGAAHPGHSTGKEQRVSAEAIPLPAAEEETGFVRPYAITGGRTKANYALELETLLSTREGEAMPTPELVEHRLIMEECRIPRSVAEIVSALRVPLGVARVLISDAADAGLIAVHRTVSSDDGAEEHLMLMERVLSGLRRL
ncbi:DUF742 domain-containing protein [Amycolatopsis cihanbeyliensis]|uniref:Uncharacterized protein DUF742 n=1 Tax=Amycolatopsis cihanbeyliensis TaxID=1128664 RepID=A0A542DDN7_AMYCI|nr:DUF742 domain-containing protein [Amycolatopsis cihanbeyliensis]TQJ01181.1 uncharacterized protein DUF742 [Amycolatopsis cihanbeyliensis]